ncbi:peroxiredoxin [Aeromicrobium sp.]|uniref:peroxiredoxin n=1 Tax=Aeromicrobium sp. TaxID=1871063 RepID=UPI003D6B05BB
MSLDIGDVAPDFTLKNQHGEEVSLSSFTGESAVLLVFFPFAFSGICSGEFGEIRDHMSDFDGAEVLAVSCDHFFANRAFADAQGLEFSVLSDFWPHGEVSRAYGIFNEDVGVAERGTSVIDRQGIVRWKVEHGINDARDLGAYREALAALA